MRNPVSIEKRKVDGTVKRVFEGDLVDADEDGWLAVFHDSARHTNYKDGQPSAPPPYVVYFLATHLPLVVSFYFDATGGLIEAQADAAMPSTIDGRKLAFVDLDLDVIVAPDMTYYVRDQETFEQNAVAMGYTPDHIDAARNGVRLAREMAEQRLFPFEGSAERVLGLGLAAEGPL
jgi:protein associated with RNAse G/E